ncbi:hypothetical protein BVX93_02350, partial [bacterium B13(2017)]
MGINNVRDLGHNGDDSWKDETIAYLGEPDANGRGDSHPEINVIMWAWCGGAADDPNATVSVDIDGDGTNENLNYMEYYCYNMTTLENMYPGVKFVYMTGHLNRWSQNTTINNQRIRDYCISNNKILYDFEDIECWDPDGNSYRDREPGQDCSYNVGDGTRGNWAIEWQNSHTEGVDWYTCESAHSQPLNANRKAYAAWWLFARLAGWEGPDAATEPPAAPSVLQANTISENQIDLNWQDNSDNESGFRIERSIYSNFSQINTITVTANTISYSDTNLNPATTYYFRVFAYNSIGDSSYSNEVNAATNQEVTLPPNAPSNFSAQAVSSTQINLSWEDNSDNEDGYRIERQVDNSGNYNLLTSLPINSTSFSDANLEHNKIYSYQVVAYNSYGVSSIAESDATTTEDTIAPDAPLLISAEALNHNQIYIVWNEPLDNTGGTGVSGYKIYRDSNPIPIADITNPSISEFTDSDLSPQTLYSYTIIAYD